jgi:prophage maintenance system killer protein
MEFHLSTTHVPIPMGLEKETAKLAQKFRQEYHEFFAWVQGGEIPLYELKDEEQEYLFVQLDRVYVFEKDLHEQLNDQERWYLERHDIEYFYALARPADIGCACPYGWVDKVNRIMDQQYAMFGVERFTRLEDKAAHIAWLLLKNEVLPDYNRGIGALAIFILLGRNRIEIKPKTQELYHFFAVLNFLSINVDTMAKDEDQAIHILGEIIKSWEG